VSFPFQFQKSNQNEVTLKINDFDASGMYCCEVSLESPIFTKASLEEQVHVFRKLNFPPGTTQILTFNNAECSLSLPLSLSIYSLNSSAEFAAHNSLRQAAVLHRRETRGELYDREG
jgi:hypothetical protein